MARRTAALIAILSTSFLVGACSLITARQPVVSTSKSQELGLRTLPTASPVFESQNRGLPKVSFWVEQVPRIDEQGAVTVEITPMNLNNPGESIDFRVNLNTHSVDLSMDIAQLSTLKTDTGFSVPALQWDATLGGHHVSGILSFPSMVDGVPLLNGAAKLVLTVVDLEATERIFVWEK